MALVLIVSCIFMLSAFLGAAHAQDAETVSALMHVGGGAGGVGATTGIASLIQSNRASKVIDGTQAQIDALFSKVNRLSEISVANDSERDAIAQKLDEFRTEMRSGILEMSHKIDGLQERHNAFLLDLARHTPRRTSRHGDDL